MTLSNGNWNIKFNQISKPVRVAEMSPDNRTLLTTSMPSTSESYAGSASPSPCRQPSEKSKSFKLWGRRSPSEAPISTNYRSCLQLPSQSLTGAPIHQTPCSSFSSKGPPCLSRFLSRRSTSISKSLRNEAILRCCKPFCIIE